jgi:hypothetical protein
MDLLIGSSSEDALLESLRFKLPPSASYIQERRLVSWYPSGASTFSPTGVREARFDITGTNWLDSASLRLQMKVRNTNTSGQVLQMAGNASALIQRMRLFIGGVLVEDVDQYGRNAMLFHRMLQSPAFAAMDGIESGTVYREGSEHSSLPHEQPSPIFVGDPMTVSLSPLLGFLATGKKLPLKYASIMLSVTFADAVDALSPADVSVSRDYVIEQVSLRGAVITLDSALEASYANLMLSGKSLVFSSNAITTQVQAVPLSTQISISVVRALSRINAVFVSFRGPDAVDGVVNSTNFTHEVGSFVNPSQLLSGSNGYSMEWSMQLGSKKYPETPCASLAETFSLLRQATGIYDSDVKQFNITKQSYSDLNFVIGVPMMNQAGVFGSGTNSRSGDLLTFTAKNLLNTGRGVGKVYIHILSEQIIEIREGQVSVLD